MTRLLTISSCVHILGISSPYTIHGCRKRGGKGGTGPPSFLDWGGGGGGGTGGTKKMVPALAKY